MICDLQQQFFLLINDNIFIIKASNATNLSTFPKNHYGRKISLRKVLSH